MRGDDTEDSDLDLLVDTLPGTTLFDLGGLQDELEAALGVRVDVRTPGDLPERIRARVLERRSPCVRAAACGLRRSSEASR